MSHKSYFHPSARKKLTLKHINSMQTGCFGIAICQNSADLYQMKKTIGAISWSCTTFNVTNDDYRHRFCPPGQLAWCKYQKDKFTGKTTHKNNINRTEWIGYFIVKRCVAQSDNTDKCLCERKTSHKNPI